MSIFWTRRPPDDNIQFGMPHPLGVQRSLHLCKGSFLLLHGIYLKVVPAKPRHILYNDTPDLTGLYIRDHLLEPWAPERCPTHSVVDIEPDVVVSPFPGISLQHLALRRDLSRVFYTQNHTRILGNEALLPLETLCRLPCYFNIII